VECVALLAERSITLYTIGCEPSITPYRDFFMALAFKTGGQYIPLGSCTDLASVIIGSAKEEISLERLLAQVHEEVMREAALSGGPIDETELTRRIHEVMHGGGTSKEICKIKQKNDLFIFLFIGVKARRVKIDNKDGGTNIPSVTPAAEHLSTLTTLKEVREKWVTSGATTTFGGLFGLGATATAFPPATLRKKAMRRSVPVK
jgi:hypothetical protein